MPCINRVMPWIRRVMLWISQRMPVIDGIVQAVNWKMQSILYDVTNRRQIKRSVIGVDKKLCGISNRCVLVFVLSQPFTNRRCAVAIRSNQKMFSIFVTFNKNKQTVETYISNLIDEHCSNCPVNEIDLYVSPFQTRIVWSCFGRWQLYFS